MIEKKKFIRPHANVTYNIDGASYGMDDGLAEAIKNSISRKLESKTLEIPRLPHVAGRIIELSRNENADVDDIVQAIMTDPMLATRIMTLANSSAYAGGQTLQGLKPALMRIGSKAVQDMVFSESIRMKIFSVRAYRSILEESWKLSLGTAIACEAISRATGIEREGAFLIGLLHDTGKPVLVSAISELEKQNNGLPIGEDIVEILMSQLHEETGSYVLKDWGMPETVVSAAGGHHAYQGAHATPAHRLVHAGNLICQHLGIGDIQNDVDFTVKHVFAELNLAEFEKIEPILEAVSRDVGGLLSGLGDSAAA